MIAKTPFVSRAKDETGRQSRIVCVSGRKRPLRFSGPVAYATGSTFLQTDYQI